MEKNLQLNLRIDEESNKMLKFLSNCYSKSKSDIVIHLIKYEYYSLQDSDFVSSDLQSLIDVGFKLDKIIERLKLKEKLKD